MNRPKAQAWRGGILMLPDGPREAQLVIRNGRIAELNPAGQQAGPGCLEVDVSGHLVIPGMVNAHDHLDFNCFSPYAPGSPYPNATRWFTDVFAGGYSPIRRMVMDIRQKYRLLAGAFKNLFSGATTVAHHDPPVRRLFSPEFPVTVPRIGHCHSLSTDPNPRRSLPRNSSRPWVIHAAEGIDREAKEEIPRLETLGCLGPGTVLVHCLGIDPESHPAILAAAGASAVWCPRSNQFLYQALAPVLQLRRQVTVALGTDSSISNGGTMLEELRAAREAVPELGCADLLEMATAAGARLFRLAPEKGAISPGAHADLALFPLPPEGDDPLSAPFQDGQPSLVVRGGIPVVGDPSFRPLMEAMDLSPQTFTMGGDPRIMPQHLYRQFNDMFLATCNWPPFGDSVRLH